MRRQTLQMCGKVDLPCRSAGLLARQQFTQCSDCVTSRSCSQLVMLKAAAAASDKQTSLNFGTHFRLCIPGIKSKFWLLGIPQPINVPLCHSYVMGKYTDIKPNKCHSPQSFRFVQVQRVQSAALAFLNFRCHFQCSVRPTIYMHSIISVLQGRSVCVSKANLIINTVSAYLLNVLHAH